MDPRALLRQLAEALPPGTAVPVPREWLLELLGAGAGDPPSADAAAPADLTVHGLAARFGRKPPTVRMWLEQGRFPGAYRFQNREWRVPPAGVAAFEAAERQRAETPAGSPAPARVVNLSSWRGHVR